MSAREQRPGRRTLQVGFIVIAISFALIYSVILQRRDALRKMTCANHLLTIGLAMFDYEGGHQRLPIGIETDKTGTPFRSWRTHLYPYFIENSQEHYNPKFAWDSPSNIRIVDGTIVAVTNVHDGNLRETVLDPCMWVWRCPSCDLHTKQMNYAVVVGEETAFPLNRPVKIEEITDGLENTTLLVETLTGSDYWTEPLDIQFDSMDFSIDQVSNGGLSSYHRKGAFAFFADRKVYFISSDITPVELRALFTISGGEPVTRQDLIDRGILQ